MLELEEGLAGLVIVELQIAAKTSTKRGPHSQWGIIVVYVGFSG